MVISSGKSGVLYLFISTMLLCNVACAMDQQEKKDEKKQTKTSLKFKNKKTEEIIEVPIEGNFYEKDGEWYYDSYNNGRHRGQKVKKTEFNKGLTRSTKAVTSDAISNPKDIAAALDFLFEEESAEDDHSSTAETVSLSSSSEDTSASTSSKANDSKDHSASKEDDDDEDEDFVDNGDDESTASSSGSKSQTLIMHLPKVLNPTISQPAPKEESAIKAQQPQPSRWKKLLSKAYEKRVVLVAGGALVLVVIGGGICLWHFYPSLTNLGLIDKMHAVGNYFSGCSWGGFKASVSSIVGSILNTFSSSSPTPLVNQCPLEPAYFDANELCPLNGTRTDY